MSKYLDENGLLYLWSKIKSYVTSAISGFYTKPSGGIPKSDLASGVQTSLGLADSALQSFTETDPVFTASAAHGISSTDISNWNAAEANVVKSVNTTAGTSGINLSLSSGALDVTISSGSVASGNANFVTGGTVYSTTSTLAPKASPTFTGTPSAPTATAGTNTTQIATTAFVTSAISTASAGLASFQGAVSAGSTISGLTNYKRGWYWVIDTAGTYVGETCEVGDFIFCISDYSSAYSASDFSVVQTNMDVQAITNAEIDTIVAS